MQAEDMLKHLAMDGQHASKSDGDLKPVCSRHTHSHDALHCQHMSKSGSQSLRVIVCHCVSLCVGDCDARSRMVVSRRLYAAKSSDAALLCQATPIFPCPDSLLQVRTVSSPYPTTRRL